MMIGVEGHVYCNDAFAQKTLVRLLWLGKNPTEAIYVIY